MTPAARVAAAIEVLDRVLSGDSAERVLTTWGRRNRFAGSGDRAAIRDHVFDALRRLQSSAALGGAMTGRGVMIGLMRAQGADPDGFFTGVGHGPAPLSPDERRAPGPLDPHTALDCPSWLAPALAASLGADFAPVMTALQDRAPLFLRVNLLKTSAAEAQRALADEDIDSVPGPLSPTALEVTRNPRRVQTSAAFRDGLVEIQDAASQAVADAVPAAAGSRVLDFCAGGGGKALALAARGAGRIFAHDVDAGRMSDLPARRDRAGAAITLIPPGRAAETAPYDAVLVDAPCSGSGAWRRAPQAKWTLDAAGLERLCALQAEVLTAAEPLVAPGGTLVYATCSLLATENSEQVEGFLHRFPAFVLHAARVLTPLDGGDGFFYAMMTRR